MILNCSDFIKSGLLKLESCCPYCHEGDSYLYCNGYTIEPIGRSKLKAVVCCTAYRKVFALTRDDWAKVLWDKRKSV